LELCRRLREFSPQIPIVFYSNDAREIDRQKGLATGAQAYLIKPEIDTVLPTILRLASPVSDSQMPVKASPKGQNRNRKIASAQKSDTF